MKESPLLLKPAMAWAAREGLKSETRRLDGLNEINTIPSVWELTDLVHETQSRTTMAIFKHMYSSFNTRAAKCRYGVPGDRLWIRETWWERKDHLSEVKDVNAVRFTEPTEDMAYLYKKRPSIFMPRWACRSVYEIVGIRVERLNEITEYGILAEGLVGLSKDGGVTMKFGICDSDGSPGNDDFGWPWKYWEKNPVMAFGKLWDSINAKRGYSWDMNPWVWVVEFRRM